MLIIKRGLNTYIKLTQNNYVGIGETVSFKNNNYFVIESRIIRKLNIIFSEITLVKKNSLVLRKINNKKIRGSSLEGKIIDIVSMNNKAYLKVDFDYGLEKKTNFRKVINKNYVLIPYKTFYSKSNTGFFPAPEINDVVDVEFYDDNEKYIKVSWCINNENSSRFNNNDIRNLTTNDYNISINKGDLTINTDSKIDVNSKKIIKESLNEISNSKKSYTISSEGFIAIESKKELELHSNEMLLNNNSSNLKIISKGDILLKAVTIHND